MLNSWFAGGEKDSSNNPFQYIKLGRIEEVIDESNDKVKDKHLYNTLIVEWLDRGGISGSVKSNSSRIPLTYTHMSRGWGLQYKPSIGDIVICGSRQSGSPVLLGFAPVDYYKKVLGMNDFGYYFRNIIEGEYAWKSKQGAEWYLDQKGSIHFIIRDQTQVVQKKNPITGVDEDVVSPLTGKIETSPVDNILYKVTIGTVWNDAFTTEIKSANGNSIRLRLFDTQNNKTIIIDSAGNIEVATIGKLQVTADVAEMCGTATLALFSEIQSLRNTVDNLVTAFNSHMHATAALGVPSGPTPVPLVIPVTAPDVPEGTQKLKGE